MKKIFVILIGVLLVTGCNEKKESKSDISTSTKMVSTLTQEGTTTSSIEEIITTNVIEKLTTTSTTKNGTTTRTSETMSIQVNTSSTKSSKTNKATSSSSSKTTTTSKKTTTTKKTTTAKSALTEKEVYNKMIALKSKYPNGTPWGNDKCYNWKGGYITTGCGCAGFAFTLSDVAFGSKKATKHTDVSKIRVGDVLRIYNDTHSVIVLSVDATGVTVAEGNMTMVGVFENAVYWGRKMTTSELKASVNYVLTRW